MEVVQLANARKLPVVITGDIFNTARASTEVVTMALRALDSVEAGVYLLPGNHDLPYHNWENVTRSSYGILAHSFPNVWEHPVWDVNASPFGLDESEHPSPIVFTHQLVFQDEKARPSVAPDCGKIPEDLVEQFPNAQWIFTGDYHTAFHRILKRDTGEEVHVVNPGCLMRQVADYAEYQPVVFAVDTEAGTIERIELKADSGAQITETYLREADAKEERLEAFFELLSEKGTVALNFRENLERRLQNKEVPSGVKDEVLAILHASEKEIA
jgi:DNA repair exonuclease SbcCD nuclease subunit